MDRSEPAPLTPDEIDALLRPDPRSTAADLLVLRDNLLRMSAAWQRIADAAAEVARTARSVEARCATFKTGQPPAPKPRTPDVPRPIPPARRAD